MKWEMLQGLKLSNNTDKPIEILPETMKRALTHEQHDKLACQLEKNSDLQVKSHFKFEFERDKRTSKQKSDEVNYPGIYPQRVQTSLEYHTPVPSHTTSICVIRSAAVGIGSILSPVVLVRSL